MDNGMNSLIALNPAWESLQEYTLLFSDVERQSKHGMNNDVLGNHFMTYLANRTVRTHTMSQRANKSTAPLAILEQWICFIKRLVVDSPRRSRGEQNNHKTTDTVVLVVATTTGSALVTIVE
jgi:hypothetical protein